MAITFIGSATGSADYKTSITVNVPASTANGDVMIAIVGGTRSGNPSGWTLIDNASSGTSSLGNVYCYYRVASSEPGSYTFNYSGQWEANAAILTYRGVNTGSPVDLTNEDVSSVGATSNFTTATITAPANTWALYFGMGYEYGSSSTRTWTQGGTGQERVDTSVSDPPSPDNCNLCVADSNGTISAGNVSKTITRSAAASGGVRGIILLKVNSVSGSASASDALADVNAFNPTPRTAKSPAPSAATGVTAAAFNPASIKAGNFAFPATARVTATGNSPLFVGQPVITVAAYNPFAYYGTPAIRFLKVDGETRIKTIPKETRTAVITDG